MNSPVNKNSLKWSLIFHGFLLLVVVGFAVRDRFIRKKQPEPVEFTVVLPQELPEPVEQKPDPKPDLKPVVEPDPVMPENLPPIRDAVIQEKKPPEKKPPEKKPEIKPPEKKPPEKKPEIKPPEKKPFEKGKRIVQKPAEKQPDFSKLKPAVLSDAKPLSRAQIEKALQAGAKPGIKNSLPESEVSRCISLVQRAMYEAWVQPGSSEAGPLPALLDIRLDKGGRIVSYRIRQSSGSRFFDQSVLKGAASVRQVRGLSLEFLNQYETLTIEFRIE